MRRTVEIPVEIGEAVYAIRNYKGKRRVQAGNVSEITFMDDMSVLIVVKNVARGKFGEKIFKTLEEATEALKKAG